MPSTILSDNGASSGTAGLKSTGSNDGQLVLQTTTAGGTATTAMTIDTGQAVTFAQTANLPNTFGFKNRIINGGMVIDQRNAGAAVTPTSSARAFPVDRFAVTVSQNSKLTSQQNAGSVTPPTGFVNYAGVTSSSAYAVISSDYFLFYQPIEGTNVADLAWGTANAKTVTLSFWVRSSLTGTFGGSIVNSAANRSYPFTYSISATNTWEYKTVTIAGDTSGTWLTTTGVGMYIWMGLGVGTTYSGTAGSWSGNYYFSATGATSVVGTNGATWYITGFQLEVGSTATSFDYRPYGTELALCQRYYWKSGGAGNESIGVAGYNTTGNAVWSQFSFPVTMRANPTVTVNGTWAVGNTGQPTIRAASTTNFLLQAVASASGNLATYPNGSDDFLDANIEL
jgi:hypothetical protein